MHRKYARLYLDGTSLAQPYVVLGTYVVISSQRREGRS